LALMNGDATDLKDDGLVVLAQVEGKDVGVHKGGTTQAQDVHSLLQELHLNPRHVVLLHLFHLAAHCCVQLSNKPTTLHFIKQSFFLFNLFEYFYSAYPRTFLM
jgi:hypothetical protein